MKRAENQAVIFVGSSPVPGAKYRLFEDSIFILLP